MPYYMYVSLQDDDKIVVFTMDARTGTLTPQGEVPVSGGPSPLTMSPDRKVLYVGHRTVPGISSFRIDPDTGALTQSGTVAPEAAPPAWGGPAAGDRTPPLLLPSQQGPALLLQRAGLERHRVPRRPRPRHPGRLPDHLHPAPRL